MDTGAARGARPRRDRFATGAPGLALAAAAPDTFELGAGTVAGQALDRHDPPAMGADPLTADHATTVGNDVRAFDDDIRSLALDRARGCASSPKN